MSDSFDFLRKHNILVKKENSIFAEICKHYNMSYADINMLDAIYDSNKITEPTILAEELLIPKQTITSMLDKLEKKGYVKRQHNENDRRKVNVMLLPEGEKLLLQVQHTIDYAERYIMNHIGKDELEDMLNKYQKIISLLQEAVAKGVAK